MDLQFFADNDFYSVLKQLFEELKVPVNYIPPEPVKSKEFFTDTYREKNPSLELIDDVCVLGMTDDAAFAGRQSIDYKKIDKDYDGIMILGVTLHKREKDLLPSRSQLAEITRAFNREFKYTPVVVIFRYQNYITLAKSERSKYKQESREGEKAGKVSLLRDVDVLNTHTGHLKILQKLIINRTGMNAVNSFAELYSCWQSVLDTSVLNKLFYKDLSKWHFWALKNVYFPTDSPETDQNRIEHNAKNLIRLLTRILFIWFIKEKKLIQAESFDAEHLKSDLLKDFQKVPDQLFFGLEELINILKSYKFTITENTPLEEDIALDPEILGVILENLLASFNTEIRTTARKQTGSFYTPREIVNYMVDESLISYLKNVLGTDCKEKYLLEEEKLEEKLQELFSLDDSQPSMDEDLKIRIINALADSKILDPACGSGAFLMGILQKMIHVLHKLDPYNERWKQQQTEKAQLIDDEEIREIVISDIEETFTENEPDYGRKLYLIENCIYGVDIQPIAVEISKMRFLISLLADKKVDTKGENLGIRPHLNLKTNLVAADTLSIFPPYSHQEWMFDIREGFHVVIGNPPYVDSETMVRNMHEQREQLARRYITAKGNWDLYIPFFEFGFSALNRNGVLCYIAPNKWLSIGYGKNLRDYFIDHVIRLCNCHDIKVFEAGNTPEIVFVRKEASTKDIGIHSFAEDYMVIDKGYVPREVFRLGNWGMVLSEKLPLLLEILKNKNKVEDYCDVENPFTVSEAYALKECVYDCNPGIDNNDLKLITTGTIDKYLSLWGNKTTSYIKDRYRYPFIDRTRFKEILPKRYEQSVSKKIIITGIRYFECYYDANGHYVAGKSTIIIRNVKKGITFETLLAILNSTLISTFISEAYQAAGIEGGVNFTAPMIKSLPLPDMSLSDMFLLDKLARQVISLTEAEGYLDCAKRQEAERIQTVIDRVIDRLYEI